MVISVEELERLTQLAPKQPFLDFMEGLALSVINLDREDDRGRDAEL